MRVADIRTDRLLEVATLVHWLLLNEVMMVLRGHRVLLPVRTTALLAHWNVLSIEVGLIGRILLLVGFAHRVPRVVVRVVVGFTFTRNDIGGFSRASIPLHQQPLRLDPTLLYDVRCVVVPLVDFVL